MLLGVRYMTLAHQRNNDWADSATDKPEHNGLTEFGRNVIREMNRQGMLVDISHVSDKTFYDALETSRAPLIASHSSVRAISNNTRNMSDDMIRALAAKGGVIQIAYEQSFLSEEFRAAYAAAVGDLVANRAQARAECGDDDACLRSARKRQVDALQADGRVPHVSWEKVLEHIDYVVRLVGVDHVGLGSDFDGASMPDGLEDCSKLPKITEALVRRGYSDRDIRKILGGNLLRVLDAAQRVARERAGRTAAAIAIEEAFRPSSALRRAEGKTKLLGRQHCIDTLLLQQDHHELRWLRHARIAPDRVYIAGALVECLSWRQGDFLAAPDPLDDRPFQHVEDGMRIVPMNVFYRSWRIDDGDHQHLLSGQIGEIFEHDRGYNGLRRLCGVRRLRDLHAATENQGRSKDP
jgi:microsomal dipeptidase-like Zn-dependent dipeptidase